MRNLIEFSFPDDMQGAIKRIRLSARTIVTHNAGFSPIVKAKGGR